MATPDLSADARLVELARLHIQQTKFTDSRWGLRDGQVDILVEAADIVAGIAEGIESATLQGCVAKMAVGCAGFDFETELRSRFLYKRLAAQAAVLARKTLQDCPLA